MGDIERGQTEQSFSFTLQNANKRLIEGLKNFFKSFFNIGLALVIYLGLFFYWIGVKIHAWMKKSTKNI